MPDGRPILPQSAHLLKHTHSLPADTPGQALPHLSAPFVPVPDLAPATRCSLCLLWPPHPRPTCYRGARYKLAVR